MKKLAFLFLFTLLFTPSLTFAQITDDNRTQVEESQEQRLEDIDRLRQMQTQPKTAEDVIELLETRAEKRLAKKHWAEFIQKRFSAGVTMGFETNPSNVQDDQAKGDTWTDSSFSGSWTPKFNKFLSGDFGYSLAKRNYFEQITLDSDNHALNAAFKYLPFGTARFSLEPGARQEWNVYSRDTSSSYEQSKGFLKFTYLIDRLWSTGGKYEYAYKIYDKKAAFTTSGANSDMHRADHRNTGEFWVKRQLGRYSIKLKERVFRNGSNSQYQHYDDYDSHNTELTVSGAFLKDYRLYLIVGMDYDVKNYKARAGDDATARFDHALQYRFNAYYTINKSISLSYSFSQKNNSSNKASGEFRDITNSLGLTINF